jgi:hypothetical protein
VIVLVHKTLDHCEYHFLLGLLLPQPLAVATGGIALGSSSRAEDMRPPQHGQGCECVGGSLASVLPALAASLRGFGTASSSRARAMLSAREVLANRP